MLACKGLQSPKSIRPLGDCLYILQKVKHWKFLFHELAVPFTFSNQWSELPKRKNMNLDTFFQLLFGLLATLIALAGFSWKYKSLKSTALHSTLSACSSQTSDFFLGQSKKNALLPRYTTPPLPVYQQRRHVMKTIICQDLIEQRISGGFSDEHWGLWTIRALLSATSSSRFSRAFWRHLRTGWRGWTSLFKITESFETSAVS
jgi:hypothetical protein